jgi:Zn-finger nucleic acid-binding protein
MNMKATCCCPRDASVLNPGTFLDVPIHLCPTCQGSLVEQVRMHSLLDAISKELQRTIPLDAPLDKVPDKGPNLQCPMCSLHMENYGYMGAHFVMVDACHACRLLWLDTAELAAMSLQFARTTRRIDMSHMQAESRRLESNRSHHSLNVANMVSRMMITGFVLGTVF